MLEVVVILAVLLLLLGAVLWAGGGKTLHEAQGSGIIETIPGALEMLPPPAEELVVLSYSIAYGLGDPRQHGRLVSLPPSMTVWMLSSKRLRPAGQM